MRGTLAAIFAPSESSRRLEAMRIMAARVPQHVPRRRDGLPFALGAMSVNCEKVGFFTCTFGQAVFELPSCRLEHVCVFETFCRFRSCRVDECGQASTFKLLGVLISARPAAQQQQAPATPTPHRRADTPLNNATALRSHAHVRRDHPGVLTHGNAHTRQVFDFVARWSRCSAASALLKGRAELTSPPGAEHAECLAAVHATPASGERLRAGASDEVCEAGTDDPIASFVQPYRRARSAHRSALPLVPLDRMVCP